MIKTKSLIELGLPSDWGLPPKFAEYRSIQQQAVTDILEAFLIQHKRFVILNAPTGSGKSAVAYTVHKLLQFLDSPTLRTCILTSSKGLQEQYRNDFSDLYLMTGRNNYRCQFSDTCEHGRWVRCPSQFPNRLTGEPPTCPYVLDYTRMLEEELVSTNYFYLMAVNQHGQGMGAFDLLICDESHDLPRLLADQMTILIDERELPRRGEGNIVDRSKWDVKMWRKWAVGMHHIAELSLKNLGKGAAGHQEMRDAENWERKMKALSRISDEWIIDHAEGTSEWEFNPLWPREHAAPLLWGETPRVLLCSATNTPKIAEILDIKPEEMAYLDYPSLFDPARSPFYLLDGVRMDSRRKGQDRAYDLRMWLAKIDDIVARRLDRKGIIHTVSYQNQEYILQNSAHKFHMTGHTRKDTRRVVEQWKREKGPGVLVSPALTTGYDFPGDQCEYQIIAKVPFADNRARPNLAKARREADKEYADSEIMLKMVQMDGRGMRGESDRSETFVVDGNSVWFVWKNLERLAPRWFREKVKVVWKTDLLPKPFIKE